MLQHPDARAAETPARDLPTRASSMLVLWHLLSLDAPCIAAVWTLFFAHLYGMSLPLTVPLALALAVWMLYAADRLADASSGNDHEERHRFHQRHRVAFAACWLACAPVLVLLVVRLPHAVRDGWLLLAIPLAAYVGAVHALRLGHVPKEPLIAVFFGTAVAMPVLGSGLPIWNVAPAAALFALLCWLNCAAIAAWEAPWSGYIDPLTSFAGRRLSIFAAVAMALALCVAVMHGPARAIGMAVAWSVFLILLLQRLRGTLDRTHVRALADAALLTPLVVWPLLTWHAR